MASIVAAAIRDLRKHANKEKAAFFPNFFKTGKGQYGEGDRFLGVTVPSTRTVAKKYGKASLQDIDVLLSNAYHEVRLLALLILVHQYESTENPTFRKTIVDFYLAHRRQVNNWDLVDLSAYKILGDYLLERDRKILFLLAKSKHLWSERIAIVSTYAFIRQRDFRDTITLATLFLSHRHDLMHKAVGWMLREVGKRDENVLRKFLDAHCKKMPRTMLRYAIEKLTQAQRTRYLAK